MGIDYEPDTVLDNKSKAVRVGGDKYSYFRVVYIPLGWKHI